MVYLSICLCHLWFLSSASYSLQSTGLLLPCCSLFSCPVISDSLRPRGLKHARPPCPSPSPGVCPSSFSLYQWCCPVISSSDAVFSFCPQSFPASETFPMSHLLTTDDQNSGASGFSIGPSREYSWLISLKIDWFDFLTVQGTFRSLLYHPSLKASILWRSAFLIVQLSQLYVTTGKTIAWKDLCQQNNVAGFQHTV